MKTEVVVKRGIKSSCYFLLFSSSWPSAYSCELRLVAVSWSRVTWCSHKSHDNCALRPMFETTANFRLLGLFGWDWVLRLCGLHRIYPCRLLGLWTINTYLVFNIRLQLKPWFLQQAIMAPQDKARSPFTINILCDFDTTLSAIGSGFSPPQEFTEPHFHLVQRPSRFTNVQDWQANSVALLPATHRAGLGGALLSIPKTDIEYLSKELNIDRLDVIYQWLWVVGRPMPPRPLHYQTILSRNIIVTEQMDLHLTWSKGRIYQTNSSVYPRPIFLDTCYGLHWKVPLRHSFFLRKSQAQRNCPGLPILLCWANSIWSRLLHSARIAPLASGNNMASVEIVRLSNPRRPRYPPPYPQALSIRRTPPRSPEQDIPLRPIWLSPRLSTRISWLCRFLR